MRLFAAIVAAGAVLVLVLPGPSSAQQTLVATMRSHAVAGVLHVRVVLPDGYANSGKRYPVIYFLHGLPASSSSYLGNRWVDDAVEAAGPAVLVFPQGARDADPDAEYLNWGPGRDWESFVAEELPRKIDARFRTIPTRAGRAIVGVSAGGYGAAILGLHHLGEFSVIESWSGYFHPTDPTGTKALARGPLTVAHSLISSLRADSKTRPTFLGFYVGRSDARFYADNVQFDRELRGAGVRHTFDVYPGGHQTSLWQKHARAWLALALRHLAPAA
jgi:enterochelin esterase-like enzyme